MWVGGYDDWTPAEQREWDRDLAELEREKEEKEQKEKKEREQKEQREQKERDERETKTWLELALDDPLYRATYTRIGTTDHYVVDLMKQTASQPGERHLVFEVVNPLYEGLNAILKQCKTSQTRLIRIATSSREHVGVTYTCYCTPKTWSFTVMDEILEGLSDQLSMKQNLNGGLLMQLTFK